MHLTLNKYLGQFDVLILSEISIVHNVNEYNLNGYGSFINVRKNRRGGGLLIFVKNDITFEMCHTKFDYFENLCGLLTMPDNTNIYLLSIYRPPNLNKTKFVNELESFIIDNTYDNIVIMGDMNLNLLDEAADWVQKYESILSANGFRKCIEGVTREEYKLDKLSKSCIDHIFVKCKNVVFLNSAIYITKVTDHYMTMVDVHLKLKNDQLITDVIHENIKIKKINEIQLKKQLESCDWSSLMQIENCNVLYETICDNFKLSYEKSSYWESFSRGKKRVYKNWFSGDLLILIKQRDSRFKRWKDCTSSLKAVYGHDYRKLRNIVNKQIQKAKLVHYKSEIDKNKNSIKETWRTINNIIGKKKTATVDETIDKY